MRENCGDISLRPSFLITERADFRRKRLFDTFCWFAPSGRLRICRSECSNRLGRANSPVTDGDSRCHRKLAGSYLSREFQKSFHPSSARSKPFDASNRRDAATLDPESDHCFESRPSMLETVVRRAFRRRERLFALDAPVATAFPGLAEIAFFEISSTADPAGDRKAAREASARRGSEYRETRDDPGMARQARRNGSSTVPASSRPCSGQEGLRHLRFFTRLGPNRRKNCYFKNWAQTLPPAQVRRRPPTLDCRSTVQARTPGLARLNLNRAGPFSVSWARAERRRW